MRCKFMSVTTLTMIIAIALFGLEKSVDAATFYNTPGVNFETGAEASARFNKGVAHFHLALTALEVANHFEAQTEQDSAVFELTEAARVFRQMSRNDGRGDELIDYSQPYIRLENELQRRQIKSPETWNELAEFSAMMTESLHDEIEALQIGVLYSIQDEIHNVILVSLDVQRIGVLVSLVWRTRN